MITYHLIGIVWLINHQLSYLFSCYFLKNVDAAAAKELMASLVKLQSSIPEVNKYVIVSNVIKFSHFCYLISFLKVATCFNLDASRYFSIF